MASNDPDAIAAAAKQRYDVAIAKIRAEIGIKLRRVAYLESYARAKGLDVTFAQVRANQPIFERWHLGLISTGYLINQTGVKFIERPNTNEGGE